MLTISLAGILVLSFAYIFSLSVLLKKEHWYKTE